MHECAVDKNLAVGKTGIWPDLHPFEPGMLWIGVTRGQKGRVVSGLILHPHKSFDGLGESAPTTAF